MTYIEIPEFGSHFIIEWIEENMIGYKWQCSRSVYDTNIIYTGVFLEPEDATAFILKWG